MYRHLGEIERLLTRPTVYTGADLALDVKEIYVFDEATKTIAIKKSNASHILFKMFDEGILNALDQTIKHKDITEISVNVTDTTITIRDNGGMDTSFSKEHDMYLPQFVITKLYTSSNYDDEKLDNDDETANVGGQNGIGAKIITVFSSHMEIDIVDRPMKERYTQTIENNMYIIHPPSITKLSKDEREFGHYFEISFTPDLARLNLKTIDSFHKEFIKKRCYDIALFCGPKIGVFYNDKKVPISSMTDYVGLYKSISAINDSYETLVIGKETYHVSIGVNNSGLSSIFTCVSLVNGIVTYDNGYHVDALVEFLCEGLQELLTKKQILKEYADKITFPIIKKYLIIFMKCKIPKPRFGGQSKEKLVMPKKSTLKEQINVSTAALKRIIDAGLEESLVAEFIKKENKETKKTDGKKVANIYVENLTDATYAGTNKSEKCTCIITEGNSAASLAKNSLSAIGGYDYFGVFPIRGKFLNVRDAPASQVLYNEEIIAIKKIFGLVESKKYTSLSELRYGSMMIMSDQDVDGFHIRGLLLNFIQTNWPELIELGFVAGFTTPLIKLKPKSEKWAKQALALYPEYKGEIWFFSEQQYNTFAEENDALLKGFNMKYFKGLGTSSNKEGEEYFKQLAKRKATYISNDPVETEKILSLAFSKKLANARKEWLEVSLNASGMDYSATKVTVTQFVNDELKVFSIADNERSLPNIIDGLKPSQMEITYIAIKNLKRADKNYETKVSIFASEVSKSVDYAHGDVSLQDAIIKMAANYCGTSNHRALLGEGQFGSRWQNGNDAASSRYIYVKYNPLDALVHKEIDLPILEYTYHEDGKTIKEPKTLLPVLPTVLLYGIIGIGTGWSTTIPCYNPLEIIDATREIINGKEISNMTMLRPYYHSFKGSIVKAKDTKSSTGNYLSIGKYTLGFTNKNYFVHVTELPVGVSIDKYVEYLISCICDDKLAKIKMKEIEEKNERKGRKSAAGKGKGKGKGATTGKGKGKGKAKDAIDGTPSTITSSKTSPKFVLDYNCGCTNDNNIDIKVSITEEYYERFEKNSNEVLAFMKLTSKISTTNMCMFVPENGAMKIKKFPNPLEIIKEYTIHRLPGYIRRRDYYKTFYKKEIMQMTEKMKFIEEVINGTIVIFKRARATIEEDLDAKGYKRMNNDSFNHLFDIKTSHYTTEELAKLQAEIDKCYENYNYYKNNTAQQLWEHDLKELEDEYKKNKLFIRNKNDVDVLPEMNRDISSDDYSSDEYESD